ncbi:SRPBCC family protein [Gordonia alkaliphila]|uniref:Polyketide cyclase / dehydrase and lipid transport n=1 Tax=Gordonia alkaliphila TaxID=1053547 RepID=A0ABP8Z246_9ACTN
MRLRDNPIIEVSRKLDCTPEQAWALVTDIALPTRADGELVGVEWLDDADAVAVGARFAGHNRNEVLGEWTTTSVVTEVEDGRRWVWSVGTDDAEPWALWGFEVDPAREGVVVRQWGRFGPGDSPLRGMIAAQPEKEARIIAGRMAVWQAGMEANLAALAAALD